MFDIFYQITVILYSLNVMIYISIDKGGNNNLLKLFEQNGIPRFKMVTLLQNGLFIFSAISVLLGVLKLFSIFINL